MPRLSDLPPATLRDALEAERVDELRASARLVAHDLPTRKGELINVICGHLASDENLRAALGRLDDIGRAALAEAAHGSGRLEVEAFRAKYGKAPVRTGWLGVLLDRGLRLPEDMRRRLRAIVPRPRPARMEAVDDLPEGDAPADGQSGDARPAERLVRETEHVAQADLMAVLRLCEAGGLRVSEPSRRPTAAAMRAVAAVLEGGDFYEAEPIAAFAWPLLLQAGGLAVATGGRLGLTARGRAALAAPPCDTVRHLWDSWLIRGPIDEFSRIEAIKGQRARGGRSLTAVPPRREAVADALADAPVSRWVGVDAFFTHMRAAHHDFEVVRDPWSLYIGDPHYGSFGYEGYGGWSVVQGRFALCLLFEYAATLGLIDVAYGPAEDARDDYRGQWGTDDLDALSRYDGLAHFRLNALGAYCLGLAERYEPTRAPPAPTGAVRVLPNLEVVFLGARVAPADALLIERYAEPRSAGVWGLSRAKMLEAIERGIGLSDLEALLGRADRPLPEAVTQLVAEVRARADRLTNRGVVRLVECADAELVHRLANDPRLRGLAARVGERCLAVPIAQEGSFRRALRQVGYALPAAGEGAETGASTPALPTPVPPARRRGRR